MNIARYALAGSVSLAAHILFLFTTESPKVFAMPVGNQASSMAINFVTYTEPKITETTQPSTEQAPRIDAPSKPALAQSQSVQPQTVSAKKSDPKIVKKTLPKAPAVEKPKLVKATHSKPIKNLNQSTPSTPTKIASRNVDSTPKKVKPVVSPPKEQDTPTLREMSSAQTATSASSKGVNTRPVLVEKPSFLSRPVAPHYPRIARKRGIEGVALIEIWLDENGEQTKQVLISSSGATMLDSSALNAVKQWQFSPYTIGGEHIAHRVQIPVRFSLD